ncbi:hypothetical protein ACP4OV_017775 [Aristida adscensionis]
MAAAGGHPRTPPAGKYYHRQNKSSEPNNCIFTPGVATCSSCLALPDANWIHIWGYTSASKDLENIRFRRVQLINFLSSLQHPVGDSMVTDKVADVKMTNHSMEQIEQKERIDVIVLDSDDEDGNIGGCKKLAETSELGSNLTKWIASIGRDQPNETMHVEGENNTQSTPYGQNSALMNQLPLQTSWQPSAHFARVMSGKRPEEEGVQGIVAASITEKRAEKVFLSLPKENNLMGSEHSLHGNENGATDPRQRKRKRKGELDPAAVNFALALQQTDISSKTDMSMEEEENMPMEKEEKPENISDGLEDYWKDFSLAFECTKLDKLDETACEKEVDNEKMENDCNHDIRIHEDLGHVCRVCGMIVRRADSIIDYQRKKVSRRRTNFYGHSEDAEEIDHGTLKLPKEFEVADIAIHPRHAKHMRPHQLEGFNFLVKNLVTDKPGGCILAHAPGSGKTFMLISFIQSFLARYPSGRPLIVLPKGIVGTWKKEWQQWQVEDIPLYDFYSVKADKRVEQLEVLKSWEAKMSILFIGYNQLSRIICGDGGSVGAACRDRLLKVPNLLILDEGHTPRNRETDVLEALDRVETPRKVVLSGTLFQNHVHEVFTVLNLVRPKFLKMESSRPIVRRIMSQVAISGRSSKGIAGTAFTESVEYTLLNDDNFTRKAHVIRGLRELTKDVLHYYKGDILDELPGLVDLSVFLKLTPRQKDVVHKLEAYEKFKQYAVGTALYMHPCLSELSEVNAEDRANNLTDKSVDSLIDSINVKDGVKTRFFINILSLADSVGEKLLAFSQYILPMKFLERLLVKMKGWHVGKEIFVISGDTSPEERELAMDQFNNSADAKVLFGSIKACGEGISLVGASRVVVLDVHLNPSVTRQAIGRAFRPGQRKKVFVYRLVAAESPEEKLHETAFKKEVIPKLLFEWNEHCIMDEFIKLDEIRIDDSGDKLLDSQVICQDIKALYRR